MIRGNSNTCLKVYIHNTLLRSSCQQPPTTYFSNKENTNVKCNSFDSLYGNVIEYTHTYTATLKQNFMSYKNPKDMPVSEKQRYKAFVSINNSVAKPIYTKLRSTITIMYIQIKG